MSPDSHEEFVAYSDEAQHNVGSVRGVGAVSLRATDGERLAGEVAALVASSGVSECKWELVRSARQSFAAEKLLAWALDAAIAGHLWIDVLTWSPDAAPALTRLRAMYARLLDQSVRSHGPRGSWRVYPDEQQALDWSRILAQTASRAQIERVAPSKSHTTPLIQVADLFAGLAVFSRSSYDAYARWRSFPDDERNVAVGRFAAPVALPASLRYRCALLDEFYTTCLRRLPGISLRTRGGLHTHATDSPIQFQWA